MTQDLEPVMLNIAELTRKVDELTKRNEQLMKIIDKEKIVTLSSDDRIVAMLNKIGVPIELSGYRYLKSAIALVSENPSRMSSLIKCVYEEVAGISKAGNWQSVERCIRHAIEATWDRGDVDMLNKYFGSAVSPKRGVPTNKQFIAVMASQIVL